MRTLFSILIIVTLICFSAQGPVSASTLDTKGTEAAISCNSTPFLESHSINADGKTTFIFHGECYYSKGDSAWNKHYKITATWDGTSAREVLSISGENKYGTLISTCPADPWLNKVTCQKKSLSGSAFDDYQITGATTYPLTGNAITDTQRTQFRAELEAKKKEAACIEPSIISPIPATGLQYHPPANVKISIRHNPDFPPKEWVITWAPLKQLGDLPVVPTQQNVTLSNLKTTGDITTGILNTSKPGSWQVRSKVYFPASCNKGDYSSIVVSFTVKEKSQAEIMQEQTLKNKQYKSVGSAIPTPGPNPDTNWSQKQTQPLQQQKLQQEKLK